MRANNVFIMVFRYMWTWVLADGAHSILSTDQVLDASTLRRHGNHTVQCLASNEVGGERYTILMQTEIEVKGERRVQDFCL